MPPIRLSLAVSTALALTLLLAACGGGSAGTATTAGTGSARPDRRGASGPMAASRSAAPAHAAGGSTAPGGRHAALPADPCRRRLGAFVGSMDSLRRRLAVGVTYDQYVDEVHAVGDTYAKVDANAVELDCLTAVGTPGEKAFNRYIEAANEWGDCVSEAGCESAEVEPVLQRQWRIAAHFLGEAREGLGEPG